MIEREFSISGLPDLDIQTRSGRIELIEGRPGAVKVSVETKDPDFTVEQRGDLILIASGRHQKKWSFDSAHVIVETPPGFDALIRTAAATTVCNVAARKFEAKTASGDIDITEAGTVTIKTASGDCRVGRVTKALRFNSASGDLNVVHSLQGSAVVVTVSGDVRIEDTDASLEVKAVSGTLHVPRFVGRTANFNAVSGNVILGIPEGTRVDLDCDLRSGKVNLPSTPSTAEKVRDMSIKVKTISGDLTIERLAG